MTGAGDTRHDDAAVRLAEYRAGFEELAAGQGLDYYPVDFELVPDTFMMEVAVYGLPVRMPHWSFGVRFIYQHVQHRMGASKIFEVVFPGNPNRAYLQASNALAENTLVTAHVLGHADFSRHNQLFDRMQHQVGYNIVEQAASRAHVIEEAMHEHGQARVERILDAALALEQFIDLAGPIRRDDYPGWIERQPVQRSQFEQRFDHLADAESDENDGERRVRSPVPPRPEPDLLWFIARHGPDLEPWERDIFLAVREESYYFHPLFACQIMNEGWASYWHARLLRKAEFLPHELYLDAIKTHSDVVRPHARTGSPALAVNPYHLGFRIWENIIAEHGIEAAFRIRAEEDDFGFVRNYLDENLADELGLFAYSKEGSRIGEDRFRVRDADIDELREAILAPKFNYGAPRVRVQEMARDGSLTLVHDAATDGRGLDLERAAKVLEYVQAVWRRPVRLETVDAAGKPHMLEPA